jgi:hypothetical protein
MKLKKQVRHKRGERLETLHGGLHHEGEQRIPFLVDHNNAYAIGWVGKHVDCCVDAVWIVG